MKAIQKGMFLYFDDLKDYEVKYLKRILTKENYQKVKGKLQLQRRVEMLFYDSTLNQYYTLFGYSQYLKKKIPNLQIEAEIPDALKLGVDLKTLGKYELRDYQQVAVRNCLLKKFGTAVLFMGAGKTLIMAKITQILDKPTLIIVPTSQLSEQIYNFFVQSGAFNIEDVGRLDGKVKKPSKFTIATMQTISSMIDNNPVLLNNYKIIMNDENQTTQQSNTGLKIFNFFNKQVDYFIGFTGTPYRYLNPDKSIEDFIMLGFVGSPIVEVGLKFLIEKGYLTRPIVYMENITTPPITTDYWQAVYKKGIEKNKRRNESISNWITYFTNKNILSLTMVNTKKHAQLLFDYLPDEIKDKTIILFGNRTAMLYINGELKYRTIEYSNIVQKIKEKREWNNIIATQVLAQGFDLPELQGLILAWAGKSFVQVMQRLGRVLRLHNNKKLAFVVDYFDKTHAYLKNHSFKRMQMYKNEGIEVITDKNYFKFKVENNLPLTESNTDIDNDDNFDYILNQIEF